MFGHPEQLWLVTDFELVLIQEQDILDSSIIEYASMQRSGTSRFHSGGAILIMKSQKTSTSIVCLFGKSPAIEDGIHIIMSMGADANSLT
jgi:hypothetical protein